LGRDREAEDFAGAAGGAYSGLQLVVGGDDDIIALVVAVQHAQHGGRAVRCLDADQVRVEEHSMGRVRLREFAAQLCQPRWGRHGGATEPRDREELVFDRDCGGIVTATVPPTTDVVTAATHSGDLFRWRAGHHINHQRRRKRELGTIGVTRSSVAAFDSHFDCRNLLTLRR
jgi:hypothetical protein